MIKRYIYVSTIQPQSWKAHPFMLVRGEDLASVELKIQHYLEVFCGAILLFDNYADGEIKTRWIKKNVCAVFFIHERAVLIGYAFVSCVPIETTEEESTQKDVMKMLKAADNLPTV